MVLTAVGVKKSHRVDESIVGLRFVCGSEQHALPLHANCATSYAIVFYLKISTGKEVRPYSNSGYDKNGDVLQIYGGPAGDVEEWKKYINGSASLEQIKQWSDAFVQGVTTIWDAMEKTTAELAASEEQVKSSARNADIEHQVAVRKV